MINFFVVDDINFFKNEFCEMIGKVMIKNNLEYKIHSFDDYNNDFFNKIKEPLTNKIFLMDINAKSYDGLKVAEIIRKNDRKSIIIFITAYSDKYMNDLLDGEYLQFGFISKSHDDYIIETQNKIEKAINLIINNKIIFFNDVDGCYSICIDDILYFKSDKDRKTLIKTTFREFSSSKTLKYFEELVSKYNFKKTHRSILINYSKVIKEDIKNKKIILSNNEEITLLSRNFLKDIKQKLV